MKQICRTFLLLHLILLPVLHQGAFGQTVSNFYQDLVVGPGAYLSGSADSEFYIFADFINQSEQNLNWDTKDALLGFKRLYDGEHDYHLPGLDLGPDPSGFRNNFAWRTILIDSGNSLILQDGNALPGGAQYVETLIGAQIAGSSITNITGNGLNIYYAADLSGNGYLAGAVYDLAGGGQLIPISPYCDGADFDLDGICDDEDNCPLFPNPDQADEDLDGHGDMCPLADLDIDQDVDGDDLYYFSLYYDSGDSMADIHEDGVIDANDLEKFAREFGRHW